MNDKQLDIDTTGWLEMTCDKCGTTSAYNVKSIDDIKQCFGCMPLTDPKTDQEKWDEAERDGKL